MPTTVFTINNRFVVDSDKNEVTDRGKKINTRLEPRLMKLLCLLAGHRGGVVTRDFIVKEIWDDYPGANDGLNQAISFLRKLLHDEHKTIIKTLPKAGYAFCAEVSGGSGYILPPKQNYVRIAAFAAAILLLFFVIDKLVRKNNSSISAGQDDREISRMDSIHQAQKIIGAKDTMGAAAKGDSIHNNDSLSYSNSRKQKFTD